MRFKCVCKRWQALIQKDRHFVDLHFTLSKTLGSRVGVFSLLIMPHTYRERCLLLAELRILSENGSGGGVAIVHTKIPHVDRRHASCLPPVNGLFCFIDIRASCVCLHNLSTRESTPWIKSAIKQQHENEGNMIEVIGEHGDLVVYNVTYINLSWDFGYDPTTKEHKVISIWVRERSNLQFGNSEDWLCEVLTVRNNSWRIIDVVPPISPYHLSSAKSVYANGSIFWLHPGSDGFIDNVSEPMIVEFNVSAENFRVVSIPNFIIDDIRVPYDSGNALMEVDGHLVLLAKKIYCSDDSDIWINNQSTSMKMGILYNNPEKRDYSCGSSTSYAEDINNYYWIEDSFLMPPFEWKQERLDCVVPIPGTDLFIVRSFDACSFYYYNWKQKSFSNKFTVDGFNSFINENDKYKPFDFRCYAFEENLLP
ncbi:hypothetical protein MKW92_050985, partial [Papaver armeniacum]